METSRIQISLPPTNELSISSYEKKLSSRFIYLSKIFRSIYCYINRRINNVLPDFAKCSLWSSYGGGIESISKTFSTIVVENLYLCFWSSEEKSCPGSFFLCPLYVTLGGWSITRSSMTSCHALTFHKEKRCINCMVMRHLIPDLCVHY